MSIPRMAASRTYEGDHEGQDADHAEHFLGRTALLTAFLVHGDRRARASRRCIAEVRVMNRRDHGPGCAHCCGGARLGHPAGGECMHGE